MIFLIQCEPDAGGGYCEIPKWGGGPGLIFILNAGGGGGGWTDPPSPWPRPRTPYHPDGTSLRSRPVKNGGFGTFLVALDCFGAFDTYPVVRGGYCYPQLRVVQTVPIRMIFAKLINNHCTEGQQYAILTTPFHCILFAMHFAKSTVQKPNRIFTGRQTAPIPLPCVPSHCNNDHFGNYQDGSKEHQWQTGSLGNPA